MGVRVLNARKFPTPLFFPLFFSIICTSPQSLFLLSFFVGSLSTSLFPLYLFPTSVSLSENLSGYLLISPPPFFFGFHTNSLSIFKSSSCRQFLSSIYTSACLDLGVSKLVTPHFCTLPTFLYYSLHSNNNQSFCQNIIFYDEIFARILWDIQ